MASLWKLLLLLILTSIMDSCSAMPRFGNATGPPLPSHYLDNLTALTVARPLPVNALFNVRLDTAENGGCAAWGEDVLNIFIQTAWDLSIAGLSAAGILRQPQTSPPRIVAQAARLLGTYFQGVGIDTPDELAIIEGETISFVASLAFVQSGLPVRLASEPPATKRPILSTLGYYQQVKNFLEHGVSDEFPINDGQSTRKPWLFCGDPFVRQHMHDVLLDNQGNVVMDERGNLLLINDDRTMRTEYKRLQRTYRVTMYPVIPLPYFSKLTRSKHAGLTGKMQPVTALEP